MRMDFVTLFAKSIVRLTELGVTAEWYRGGPVTDQGIERVRAATTLSIPDSLLDFYRQIGNGMIFRWKVYSSTGVATHADIDFPSLERIIQEYEGGKAGLIHWIDTYDHKFAADPAEARQLAVRMREWLPLLEDFESNALCIDCGNEGHPIVYHDHSWMDGGGEGHSHVVAPSLEVFIQNWSEVCFQEPYSMYWPDVFEAATGVDWKSDEFQDQFRIV
jgi:hypothetical protein